MEKGATRSSSLLGPELQFGKKNALEINGGGGAQFTDDVRSDPEQYT